MIRRLGQAFVLVMAFLIIVVEAQRFDDTATEARLQQ